MRAQPWIYIILFLAISVWISLGYPGWPVFAVGLAMSGMALFGFAATWICSVHEASPLRSDHPAYHSLRRSTASPNSRRKIKLPQIWVYPGVEPQLSVLQSPFVGSRILVSQGLLGVVQEPDLRSLFALSVEELNEGPMWRRSFWCALSSICIAASPESWLRTVFYPKMRLTDIRGRRLAVLDALLFIALFPILEFLRNYSERYAWSLKAPPTLIPQNVVWGEPAVPGMEATHLFRSSPTRARF